MGFPSSTDFVPNERCAIRNNHEGGNDPSQSLLHANVLPPTAITTITPSTANYGAILQHIDPENGSSSSNSSSSSSLSSPPSGEKLGVLSMAVLVFYNVSGGPFGIETTVRAGGNLYALLGFIIMPLVWSLPEALVTAELGTAFPEASGGVVWVEEAFGPLAGWMSGFQSWVAGATDNAIYPVLFLDYLLQVAGTRTTNDDDSISGDYENDDFTSGNHAMNPFLRFSLLTSTTVLLAYINWRGLALVGKLSVLICVLAMSPFVIMVVVGSFQIDPSRWLELPTSATSTNRAFGGILWRPFLNNLLWNLSSFDSAGSLVAELDNPRASFAQAMMLGVAMVAGCYFFPLLVAIGSCDAEEENWTDGYMAVVNAKVVGPWLGTWTVFAAWISNIGLFQAELSSDAFQLMGMADRGYLPEVFSKRSRHGTPTYGLVLGTMVVVAMGAVSDLDKLIELLNFNYGITLVLEYAAFFKLRVTRPDLERPYRIPFGTLGCGILLCPTVLAMLLVLCLATYETYCFALGTSIIGYGLYAFRQLQKKKQTSNT